MMITIKLIHCLTKPWTQELISKANLNQINYPQGLKQELTGKRSHSWTIWSGNQIESKAHLDQGY